VAGLLDHEFVDSILSFGGSEMLGELLGIFRESVPARLAKLQELATSDPAAARRVAHSLRSSGGNIGASAFADLARIIEVEAGDEQLASVVAELTAMYDKTIEAFEALPADQP
jgi:HPt (histidine-containing phosphotransfer) domain-containing protein